MHEISVNPLVLSAEITIALSYVVAVLLAPCTLQAGHCGRTDLRQKRPRDEEECCSVAEV